jgi:phenylpropionate dioxygenase-like ring-hydroxylating dioxygenase large terminal subunit
VSDAWPITIARGWHPVAYERELRPGRPLRVRLMDQPIALFRTSAGPAALIDRCPHRNVPLSGGKVCGDALVCPYHGWSFDASGRCVAVPGVRGETGAPATRVAVTCKHGLLWANLADDPLPLPDLPAEIGDTALDGFWWPLTPRTARALDALENHLDPMHPHFLHPYLVRGAGKRMTVPVTVRSTQWGGEARYAEEHLPQTLLPRIIEGKRIESRGRYNSPLTGQVAFENSSGLTIAISVIFSPVAQNVTRPYAHFATPRGKMPAWLKRFLIIAFHKPVVAQDAGMLERQVRNIAAFGGASFATGPADVLGPLIWQHVHGKPPEAGERRFELEL